MRLLHYLILSFLFVRTNVHDNSILIIPKRHIQTGGQKNDSLTIKTFYVDKENEVIKKLNDLNDSIDKLHKNVQSKPTTVDGYIKLASALAAVGHTEEALSAYESALKIQPDLFMVRIDLGDFFKSLGRLEEAKQCYLKAIETKGDYGVAWLKLAYVYQEEGNMQSAVDHLFKAVGLDPSLLDAFLDLGRILKGAGHLDSAVASFTRALQLDSKNSVAYFNLAWTFLDQDKLDLSKKTFQQAPLDVQLQPMFNDVYFTLGAAFHKKERIDEAVECYKKVLELNSTHAASLNNLAMIRLQQNSFDEASQLFEKTLQTTLTSAETHYNYGICLYYQGKLNEAVHQLKDAARIDPSLNRNEKFGKALIEIGNKYVDTYQLTYAEVCYTAALIVKDDFPMAHGKLGVIYQFNDQMEKAIVSYRKALQYDPNFYDVFIRLEHCLETICDWTNFDERIAKLVRIVRAQLNQNLKTVSVTAYHSLVYPFTHEERKAIAVIHANEIQNKGSSLNKRIYTYPKSLTPDGRLRIGYVSVDFRDHAITHLMQSLPGLHDRKKVEIFCYSLSADDGSSFRAKIARESEHFVDLTQIPSDSDAADKINADGIHILINMNGYTTGARNEIFAMRPAPIQAMWLGYPGTSGASFMDYIITDQISAPLELVSQQFTEKVAYLPKTAFVGDQANMFQHIKEKLIIADESVPMKKVRDNTALVHGLNLSPFLENSKVEQRKVKNVSYTIAKIKSMQPIRAMVSSKQMYVTVNGVQLRNGVLDNPSNILMATGEEVPQDIVVTTRQQYGLPDDAIVFCNFQQLFKINPTIFKTWTNILKRVPKSVLWLQRFPVEGEKNMLKNAQHFGIESKRIIFCNRTENKEEHMRRIQLADIFLDTNVYNGHTTVIDSLYAGVPVLTLPGETLASRVAAALLTAHGCPELITNSLKEYEDVAVKLGTDAKYLKTVKAKFWAQRSESTLFNVKNFATNIERLFKLMWNKFSAGKKPNHITELVSEG